MESIIQSAVSRQASKSALSNKSLDEFVGSTDAKIMVVGAGGMGTNAINRLSSVGIVGAETIALNTDMKHLKTINVRIRLRTRAPERLTEGSPPTVLFVSLSP